MNPYEFGARWIGMRERVGPANDPFVSFINHLAGGPPSDDEAWCGSFVHFVAFCLDLERPGLPRRARSWLTVGEKSFLDRIYPPEGAAVGDVAIFSRGPLPQPGADVLDAQGHVGILAPRLGLIGNPIGGVVNVLGGNQSDAVTIQAFPISRVLGVRRLRPEAH